MNYSKFARFRTVGKKPKVQKFPAQKSPKVSSSFDDMLKKSKTTKLRTSFGSDMPKSFYERPPLVSLSQERISKVGRRVESGAFGRMSKIRTAAASRIKAKRDIFGKEKTKLFVRTNSGLKQTPFGKRVKAKVSALQTRAFKLAEKKGAKVEAKMSQKLGITPKRFGSKKTEYKNELSSSESRDLGFAPKQSSSSKYLNLSSKYTPGENITYKINKSSQKYKFDQTMRKSNPRSKVSYYDSATGKLKTKKK